MWVRRKPGERRAAPGARGRLELASGLQKAKITTTSAATLRIRVANPTTSMKSRLGSNGMRYFWRQPNGNVDLDHMRRLLHRATPADGCRLLCYRSRDRSRANRRGWTHPVSVMPRKKIPADMRS